MRERRFYHSGTIEAGAELLLVKEQFNHIKVLRLKEGARITVFDGYGNEAEAVIEKLERARARVKVEKIRKAEKNSLLVILAASPIKANRMDFLLEKSCELGVDEILPVLFERAVVKIGQKEWKNKRARWEKILISAAKQSKRADLPKISEPVPLENVGELFKPADILVLCDRDGAHPSSLDLSSAKRIFIFVGPEGGLAEHEKDFLVAFGAKCVALSSNVLRTETACVAALSIINSLLKKGS